MGQYHKLKCPICGTVLELETQVDHCAVCKAYIGDRFWQQGEGTGIPPLPITDTEE